MTDRESIATDEMAALQLTHIQQPYLFASRDFNTRRLSSPTVNLYPSIYLIQNINLFGALGGFDALQHHITHSNVSLSCTVLILRTLSNMRSILNSQFASSYFSSLELQDVTTRCVQGITDDELKNIEKKTLQYVLADVQNLLYAANELSSQEIQEWHEFAQLNIALRMLNSGVLAMKMEG